MLGGPRRLSGESARYFDPPFGRTMSGFVKVGEGGAGSEGSGLSNICGVCERSVGPSQETTLLVAARA